MIMSAVIEQWREWTNEREQEKIVKKGKDAIAGKKGRGRVKNIKH